MVLFLQEFGVIAYICVLCGIENTAPLKSNSDEYDSMKVLSTYKILKAKAFNENIDETWVDWAVEMMEAGYQSDNLYILAGETKPFNQFELQVLTKKVLEDLGFSYADKETVLNNYVYYLIANSVDHPETYYMTLRELKNICLDLNMNKSYMDFYLLYFAKDDLIEDEVQWYWNGANRENIDQIIQEHFKKWMKEFEQDNTTTTA